MLSQFSVEDLLGKYVVLNYLETRLKFIRSSSRRSIVGILYSYRKQETVISKGSILVKDP